MIPPTIHTERLTLRPLKIEDFEPLRDFYASDRSSFVGGPADAEQTWRILAGEIGHWTLRGYGRWAVEETATGRFVGLIGAWNPEGWPEPEIGWDLMNGFEGKGFATEAASAARDWCYASLGWNDTISLIAPANAGSKGVATRLGATHESTFTHVRFGEMEIWRHPSASQTSVTKSGHTKDRGSH